MGLRNESSRSRLKFWQRSTRALQFVLAIGVAGAVWGIGVSSGSDAVRVVPNTETQFSLDLEVISTVDHDIVYAVEQRARPYYRIFSLDPRTGGVGTVYTVPEGAIVYGIALNPARDTLAVAYTPDYTLEGSGIWTIDLATNQMTELITVDPDVYLTDLTWSPDGDSILATQVDRRAAEEQLSVARIAIDSGTATVLVDDAMNPIQVAETVYFLNVDENQARRTIGSLDAGGATAAIEVDDSSHDLDHLLAGQDDTSIRVAVLEPGDGGLSIGQPAAAHGNHDVASSWWDVSTEASTTATPSGMAPIIVYDAATSGDAIVYATGEGLAIGSTTRTDVIKSRAIRFVAS